MAFFLRSVFEKLNVKNPFLMGYGAYGKRENVQKKKKREWTGPKTMFDIQFAYRYKLN